MGPHFECNRQLAYIGVQIRGPYWGLVGFQHTSNPLEAYNHTEVDRIWGI